MGGFGTFDALSMNGSSALFSGPIGVAKGSNGGQHTGDVATSLLLPYVKTSYWEEGLQWRSKSLSLSLGDEQVNGSKHAIHNVARGI